MTSLGPTLTGSEIQNGLILTPRGQWGDLDHLEVHTLYAQGPGPGLKAQFYYVILALNWPLRLVS